MMKSYFALTAVFLASTCLAASADAQIRLDRPLVLAQADDATGAAELPVKKKKKKDAQQQSDQPSDQQSGQSSDQQSQAKKKKKLQDSQQQSGQSSDQQVGQSTDQQSQTKKKKKAGDQGTMDTAAEQPVKKKKQPAAGETNAGQQMETAKTPASGAGKNQQGNQADLAAAPEGLSTYLGNQRPVGQMSEAELRASIAEGRRLLNSPSLPRDARPQVQSRIKAARAEFETRKKQGGSQINVPGQTDQAGSGQGQGNKPATGETPKDVSAYLGDQRAVGQLSDAELKARLAEGRRLLKSPGLAADNQSQIRNRIQALRTESQSRQQSGGKQQDQTDQSQTGQIGQSGTAILGDQRAVKDMSEQELTARVNAARAAANVSGVTPEIRQRLILKAREARVELIARRQGKDGQEQAGGDQQTTGGKKPQVDPKKVEELDSNRGSPASEAKAQAYLKDTEAAQKLSDAELNRRLNDMRALLGRNDLSRDTERSLRQRLQKEKEILRRRVAEKETKQADDQSDKPWRNWRKRERDDVYYIEHWQVRDVLRDRRRSDELRDAELRRRIAIYRDALNDSKYTEQERRYWRETIERDRRVLRVRLADERREREAWYRERRGRDDVNIRINVVLHPDRPPPPEIWAAEADDEAIEEQLIAPPRRQVERRYTVAEIEEAPEGVRDAMPAVEIDTLNFGFDEDFLREEEVDKLDRIGGIIERIVAAHPGEVFLIEGHTDAVGSPDYNLDLSRRRAEAVKQALSTYYIISEKNLEAVGYGARFLKVPTAEEEPENRRVTLRRVTPLVGEVAQD